MIGKRFSHFRITAKLGEGGMGEVWEAFDSELERSVAVKVLPAAMADDEERLERFRREARVIASLDHPNIVTVHAIEELEGQRLLVMERLEGATLDELLPDDGLPLDELLELAIPTADALAAAHERGVVHRDLKPGNVMVTPEGRLKLLDFGLAKTDAPAATPRDKPVGEDETTWMAPLTTEGTVMGTAPYMSPEQLQGEVVDARSDVFSLGILLYEMATGGRPFRGAGDLGLASSILKDQPPDLCEVRPDLPRQLARIVDSCLAKDPDERFQTARDVRNQLAALERESTAGHRVPRAGRRSSAALWIAAAAVVALLLAGYLAWSARSRPEPPIPVAATFEPAHDGRLMLAVLPFENLGAPEDEYFAAGLSEEIRSRLARIDGLGVISRTSARQYGEDRPAMRQIGEELGVDYIVEGTVRWQGSEEGRKVRVTPQLIAVAEDLQLWTDTYNAVAEDIFGVQSDIALQVAERLDLELLDAHRRLLAQQSTDDAAAHDAFLRGDEHFATGKELQSRDEVLAAIELFEGAVDRYPSYALAWARLAEAHGYLYFQGIDRTEERRAAGREAVDRALELEPELPEAHYALAYVLVNENDFEGAIAEFNRVVESRPNYAEAYWTLSLFYVFPGLFEQANEMAVKAVTLNPRAAKHHCQVGGTNIALGNYEEAILHHDHAIRLTPERSCPYYCKIEAAMSLGDFERAARYLAELPESVSLEEDPSIGFYAVVLEMIDGDYQGAIDVLDSTGPAAAYEASWSYRPKASFAALLHRLAGDEEAAVASWREALAHLEPLVEERPRDTRLLAAVSLAYAGLGRDEEAVLHIDRALERFRPGGVSIPYALREMALARLMMDDVEGALDLLERHLAFSGFLPPAYIEAMPYWEPLRQHPRFRELMASGRFHGRKAAG